MKWIILAGFTSESDLSGKSVIGRLIIGILPRTVVWVKINRSLGTIPRNKHVSSSITHKWDSEKQAALIYTRNICLTCQQQQNRYKSSPTLICTHTCTHADTTKLEFWFYTLYSIWQWMSLFLFAKFTELQNNALLSTHSKKFPFLHPRLIIEMANNKKKQKQEKNRPAIGNTWPQNKMEQITS